MTRSYGALPPRLRAVAELLGDWKGVADIGSDHALLPISLALSTQGSRGPIIATDIACGPVSASRKAVAQSGVDRWVDVRAGYGLETLRCGEVDTIVVAGMGHTTIRRILQADLERASPILACPTRLVLQASGLEQTLRFWLQQQGFALVEQRLVSESGHFYLIDVLTTNAGLAPKDLTWSVPELQALGVRATTVLRFGPILLSERHENLGALLASERCRLGLALAHLLVAAGRGLDFRAIELREELREIEVMQQWVSRSSG